MRHHPARRPLGRLVPATGVLAVLAIAFVMYAFTPRHAPGTGSGERLTGVRWHLVALRFGHRNVALPAGCRAEIRFSVGGRISGLDGIHPFEGGYRANGHTLAVRLNASGAVGVIRANDSVRAFTSLYAPAGSEDEDDAVASRYVISAGTLTITTPGWILVFRSTVT